MVPDNNIKTSNSITIDGVTFKTEGNITFSDSEEDRYYLAQGSQLEKMQSMLEHGMQMLLKKIKT